MNFTHLSWNLWYISVPSGLFDVDRRKAVQNHVLSDSSWLLVIEHVQVAWSLSELVMPEHDNSSLPNHQVYTESKRFYKQYFFR